MLELLFSNKSLKQTLVKNTIWLTLGEAISRFSKFFLILFAARILQPEGYGKFNYLVSFLALFFEFNDIGLTDYFIKAYQDAESKQKVASAFMTFKLILISAVSVVALGAGFYFLPKALFWAFFIVFLMTIVDKFKGSFVVFATASQEMEKQSWVFVLETVTTTIVGIAVLLYKKSLVLFCLAYLTGSSLAFVLAIYLTKDKVPKLSWNPEVLKPVAKGSLPFIIISFCNVALISSDTIMIGWMKGMADVGYFSAGQRIFKLITQNLEILLTVAYPVLCGFIAGNENVTPLMRKIVSITTLLTFPIMCIGIAGSAPFISFIFGKEYLAGQTVFCLFMLFIPIMSIYEVFARFYLASNSKKNLIQVIVGASILNVVLNLIFIPKLGINGAVLSSIVARISVVVYMLVFQKMGEFVDMTMITKSAIAAIIAGMICQLFETTSFGLIMMGGSLLIYIAMLFVLKERNTVLWFDDVKRMVQKKKYDA